MTSSSGRAFNDWLRSQLKVKKMSQRQLAQQSGVDHSTISRLIRGDRMPSLGTATIAIATDIGDKISEELRSYGANISVVPQEDTLDLNVGGVNIKPASEGAFLSEADLPKIKGIFWRNNIRGFAPFLSTQVTLGKGSTTRNVELIGTYFNKPLRYGKDDFTTGVVKTNP